MPTTDSAKRRALRTRIFLSVVLLAVAIPSVVSRAAFNEREVKAVFLFNFAQFVEWPDTAFTGPDAPLVIGVLGDDPFGPLLDEAIRGEVVKGHPLTVARFRRVEEVTTCHVLFVSRSEVTSYDRILAMLGTQPTLTVGETETFTTRGMIRFLTEQNRIRLEVNLTVARAAGLTISSNLLRAARIVGAPRG